MRSSRSCLLRGFLDLGYASLKDWQINSLRMQILIQSCGQLNPKGEVIADAGLELIDESKIQPARREI